MPRQRYGRHTPAVHLLAALDQQTCYILRRARVPVETNEHKAALALRKAIVPQGRVIADDAAFCQRALCRQVIGDGGHYLLKVDDNQPTLLSDIAMAFEPSFSPYWRREAGRQNRPARPTAGIMGIPRPARPHG